MNTKRLAASSLVAVTLVAGLAGALGACSPGTQEEPTPVPSGVAGSPGEAGQGAADSGAEAPAEGVAGPEEEVVVAALRGYQQALATGDFGTACALSTADAQARVLAEVQAGGGQAADCAQAMAAVFAQPGAPELAAESAASTVVRDVVIEGLNATVSWTWTGAGQARTDSAALQYVEGQWRLVSAA